MGSAIRTTDHEGIRRWAEDRGGLPTIVKGTEGLLRIDFVRGKQSGGRAASLEEVSWDRWFEIFDDNGLTFLCANEPDSKFFKLVRATREEASEREETSGAGGDEGRGGGTTDEREWNSVLVTHEDEGWVVELEGRAEGKTFARKAEAVQHARELARKHPPAELVIESSEGDEQERVHYGSPDQHAST
jgi:hypothetical protein